MRTLLVLAALTVSAAAQGFPSGMQSDIDPQLWNEIEFIKTIDHHSHIPKFVAPGEPEDDEFDALPVPAQVLPDLPVGWRPELNPLYLEADKVLFNYPFDDYSPEHMKRLNELKAAARNGYREHYQEHILDKLNTQILFANRVAMGPGLTSDRFRWVPFDDALMYPLNNDALQKRSPVDAFYWPRENALLARYTRESGVTSTPKTLADYLARVVTPTLERQRHAGAVAIKFEMAYLRSLQSEPVARADADAIYAKYVGAGAPPDPDYTRLQDFLLRYIAKDAGRLHMPVHFHTGAGGTYNFDQKGASALNLNSLVNDPAMSETTFVMLHGNVPNPQDAAYMMTKKNTYADCSEMDQFLPPRAMASILRYWMEWVPEKVMFASDLSPDMWEEQGYVASRTVRLGLAIALTGMMRDGEIGRPRANQLAHMVLHDNAAKLYGLP